MNKLAWRMVLRTAGVALLYSLAGCAAPVAPEPPAAVLADLQSAAPGFAPRPALPDRQALMHMSPEMLRYLHTEIDPQVAHRGAREALLDALYFKGRLQLQYDSGQTRTAAEAFAAGRGNCLSLVLLTAAFAREMGLPVRFRSVQVDEVWSREQGLLVLAGHVNLSVGLRSLERKVGVLVQPDRIVDFLPGEELGNQQAVEIRESTIVAMYMNNRAAELLNAGATRQAFWWAREAVSVDPDFAPGLITLGVIYHRAGLQGPAESAFRAVLARSPDSTLALSNLALLMQLQGRTLEQQALQSRLQALQKVPPLAYFNEGVAAMKRGELDQARRLFARELARNGGNHEVHFWMALALYAQGDRQGAAQSLAEARDLSPSPDQQHLYEAKLRSLQAHAP